jgi:hypothetical protein
MIDESILSVEETTDISINGRHFKWNRSLTDLLSTKNVSRGVVTTDDQKRYKTILQLTNANLQGYESGGYMQTWLGPKLREVISKSFQQTRGTR